MDIHDPPTLTITALLRRAVDDQGNGPAIGTLRRFIKDGLLHPVRDSSGRYLFRPSDADRVIAIYQARALRHGATGQRS